LEEGTVKAAARFFVLASALLLCMPAMAQELQASSVKELMARLDAALVSRDFQLIERHLAAHAVISGTTTAGGQTQSFRMNKTQYMTMLTTLMSAATDYSYERTNERISIEGDQATVTANVADSMVIQGRKVASTGSERCTVEYVDGELMVTRVVLSSTPSL
jgi:hypothetical protein